MRNFSLMLLHATLLLAVNNWVSAEPGADNPNPTAAPVTQMENAAPPAAINENSKVEQNTRRLPPRLQQMKESLNLTNEQQDAWQKFEDTWIEQMNNLRMRSLGKINKMLTAPERLQHQINIMEQRLEVLKKISVVQQELYQILTPQQKQILDNKPNSEPKPKIAIQPNPKVETIPNPTEIKTAPEAQVNEKEVQPESQVKPEPQVNPEVQTPQRSSTDNSESKPEEEKETSNPPPHAEETKD